VEIIAESSARKFSTMDCKKAEAVAFASAALKFSVREALVLT